MRLRVIIGRGGTEGGGVGRGGGSGRGKGGRGIRGGRGRKGGGILLDSPTNVSYDVYIREYFITYMQSMHGSIIYKCKLQAMIGSLLLCPLYYRIKKTYIL